MGRFLGRGWLIVAALLVAGALLAVPTLATPSRNRTIAHAPASHRHHTARTVTLRPLAHSERELLQARLIRVRVSVRRPARLRLFVTAQTGGSVGPAVVITSTRTLRVTPRHPRRVMLRLIAAASTQLRRCGQILEVRAVLLAGPHRPSPLHVYRARRVLTNLLRHCPQRSGLGATGSDVASPGQNPRQGGASDAKTNPDQGSGSCDPIDPRVCLQPFPNDYFTVADPGTDTGRRVNLSLTSMPTNRAGKPIDPADINRNDGFSPGAPIVTKVPGMDTPAAFARTGAVPLTDLARTYGEHQPVVLINTRTLQRQLIWSEIDANPTDPANRALTIHPAVNLQENTRYIVALRDMRDAGGHVIAPSPVFRDYRDATITTDPAVERRRAHFEGLFNTLAAAGINREGLNLAWDFTVASERSLSERQLAIRNDAYRQLGDTNLADGKVQGQAPPFTVTKVTDFTPQQNAAIARRVEGTYTVPCYLNLIGCPTGSRFLYPTGSNHGPPMPIPGNTETAKFTCNIPQVAMTRGAARPSLYGHGLFGSRDEVNQGQAQAMDQEHDFMYCATDWVGMACTDLPPTDLNGAQSVFTDLITGHRAPASPDCDVPTAIAAEGDLSNFPTLVDRVDQSFVNFMYLGRLMIHPDGFSSSPAFQSSALHGASVIDTRRLFYDGNSQGGIFGGSLIALEPDLDRGVIGVPGQNYAVLLQRSSDFGTGQPPSPSPSDPTSVLPQYAYPLYQAYPNELERQLILSLMQQMWDHSDPDGLAAHMTTNPLPDTPVHHVLMHLGLGDHQVSNYAAETEARTIGASARMPWADPGRFYEKDPTYGLPPIGRYPFDGSAIVTWDIGPIRPATPGCEATNGRCGTAPDPIANVPPEQGTDPHEAPRNSVQARQMKSDFLQIGGQVTNTCGSRPCYAFGWTGPPAP